MDHVSARHGDHHRDAGQMVVLVSHGSRREGAAEAHRALCREVADRAGVPVQPAFLEMAEPSVAEALDQCAASATSVVVVPHFLSPGNHTIRDLPALVEDARGRHPGVEFHLVEHTGAAPELADLVASRVAAALVGDTIA